MSTTPDTPTTPPPSPPQPRRFLRSSSDRIIGGVCGGLGRYFGIDATLVRIAFIALALLGGTGLVVYAAALLLVPDDGEAGASSGGRDRAMLAAAAIALTIAGFALGLFGNWGFGGWLVQLAFLVLAGVAVWWFVSGERPTGGAGDVLRRAALGVGLLAGCGALAVGSFFASGLGGGGVVAGLVIAAGAGLVAAAFVGGARWLVIPALLMAIPLAFVAATDIDLTGGVGERDYRPASVADLDSSYRLGVGDMQLDLSDVDLPPGTTDLDVRVGMGHAQVLVPDDACVRLRGHVGAGTITLFDRTNDGLDVTVDRAAVPAAGAPVLAVDARAGVGRIDVDRAGFGVDRLSCSG
jgi:phage shock protein PspC (stress-responsive transcriptional regulator)